MSRIVNFRAKNEKLLAKVLKQWMVENGGSLTAEDVVQRSRPKASPLHHLFDWDNDSAGEKYRIAQARGYIGWVKIELVEGKKTRAFVNVEEEDNRSYVTIQRALANVDMRKQLVDKAWRELVYWKEQYATLSEFKPIFERIKVVGRKLKKVEV